MDFLIVHTLITSLATFADVPVAGAGYLRFNFST